MSLCLSLCRQQILRCRLNNYSNLRSIIIHQRRLVSHLSDSNVNQNLPLLDRSHHELVKRIKNLLINVQTDLKLLSAPDKKLLNEAQMNIDSIFLLVVVGEFNSGKSQFINTLLNEKEEVCPTGVLPTTDVIHILKYGTKRKDVIESDHVKSIYLPNEWLRQTNIVDTPGTNAILQTHQQITEHFIPRSDYILFVTSVDRPFSESERLFLVRIHEWRKKVLIILNKIDQIHQDVDKEKILNYVRNNARQVLDDTSVPIFPISALKLIGINELENYLRTELNDKVKLRLKLENPLGIAESIFDKYLLIVQERKQILVDDEQVLIILYNDIDQYHRQMLDDFKFQLNKIDNIFFHMIDNLEEFLLEYIKLSRLIPTLFSTSSSSEVKVQFNNRVNKNIEQDINHCVSNLCDWLIERSNRTVHQLNKHLNSNTIHLRRQQQINQNTISEVNTDFSISRQKILNQLQTQCQNILYKQKTATGAQADDLSASIRSTMIGTAAIEVGAVGLGALATLASFDWTGLLGASLIGILGLYLIPMRRLTIKQEMKDRIDKTRIDLTTQLENHFLQELDLNERKMRELIMPYSQFVQNEEEKLKKTTEQIDTIRKQIKQLKLDIQTSLPKK
ncbi:unnamed protein product [Adineta steineri]|uniref:Dynamin N-terminal domain-containing protein n=1 Tax=Adineta steineri TaxID=433720 RepID=A0A816BK53_9BILA|nr:unnamed protein product [Adineta steineri]